MAPPPWKVWPAVPTPSLVRLAEFTDSSWRGITNPVLRDEARDRYLVAWFGDFKKIEPQGEGSKTKVVLRLTRTKGGPPKVGQVISQAGPHPTQKIITAWGSYVITKIGGAADLRHFPSTLDGLSQADLVHAYREVLFDVKSEPRSLWKSIKELGPELFVALPDVLVEAMVGPPPRAVFQAVSRLSCRTEPRSDQEYHEALGKLRTWHQFPAQRALDCKEDAQRRKRRERGRRPRGEPVSEQSRLPFGRPPTRDVGIGASMTAAKEPPGAGSGADGHSGEHVEFADNLRVKRVRQAGTHAQQTPPAGISAGGKAPSPSATPTR